jgi:hypothetical protein
MPNIRENRFEFGQPLESQGVADNRLNSLFWLPLAYSISEDDIIHSINELRSLASDSEVLQFVMPSVIHLTCEQLLEDNDLGIEEVFGWAVNKVLRK